MAELKDSGARRDFGTGAVRDAADGKGRCDLLPLRTVGSLLDNEVFACIDEYVRRGDKNNIELAIVNFVRMHPDWKTVYTAILEVSKQYEDGCRKYGDRNWEKGIPVHCYIDSGVRHYLKYLRGDKDEPHDRAFVWNMLGAIWTHQNKPELIDLPFNKIDDNVVDSLLTNYISQDDCKQALKRGLRASSFEKAEGGFVYVPGYNGKKKVVEQDIHTCVNDYLDAAVYGANIPDKTIDSAIQDAKDRLAVSTEMEDTEDVIDFTATPPGEERFTQKSKNKICKKCNGTGKEKRPVYENEPCSNCKGTGDIVE